MIYLAHALRCVMLTLFFSLSFSTTAHAQAAARGALEGGKFEMPKVEQPAKPFKTAEEHYNYLLKQAKGGTKHTKATIPMWDGIWGIGPSTIFESMLNIKSFFEAMSPGPKIREGVLTPAYEKQFKARRAEIDANGQQLYDRLTACEYPGAGRWLWEPYAKEFINTPKQTWMMNDFMNETRRIYIGGEHVNIEAKHFSDGDSIGFWNGDKLIIWTKWLTPADFQRGMPLTSNQLEMVETWQLQNRGGKRMLITQVTFYDPLALLKPLSAVYTHEARPDLEKSGLRIRNWECSTSSNSYKDKDGRTQFYLPGDPEYKDPQGTTDFPDLPGQTMNPIAEAEAHQAKP